MIALYKDLFSGGKRRGRPDEGIGPYGFTGELVTGEKRWNNTEVVPYKGYIYRHHL